MRLHSKGENLVRSIHEIERVAQRKLARIAPDSFIKALQHEPILCRGDGCFRYVDCVDVTPPHERVKSFHLHCPTCGWDDCVQGHEEGTGPWGEAELQTIVDEHLLHLETICPCDHAPVIFTSLSSPPRRARYRIACHYCGRQVEMDWPPQEAKW